VRFVPALVLGLAAAGPAWAGAWTQEQGRGQLITTVTAYRVTSGYDRDRKRVDQTRFEKLELQPYFEYGVTAWLTVGAAPSYQWLSSGTGDARDRNQGLADAELFARTRLYRDEAQVVSAQGMVRVPMGYSTRDTPALGYDQVDLEARLLYGRSGRIGWGDWFVNLEGAYRWRLDTPADEVRLDLTAGLRPWERWQLLAQSFNIIGMRNAGGGPTVQPSAPDYDLFKLQLSVVYDLTPTWSVQFGGYTEYAGRNTGAGNALLVALWTRF